MVGDGGWAGSNRIGIAPVVMEAGILARLSHIQVQSDQERVMISTGSFEADQDACRWLSLRRQ